MNGNITEFAVILGESINWLNIIIGTAIILGESINWLSIIIDTAVILGKSINWLSIIVGTVGALFGIYIWFYDRENTKKATLYFPLFMACRDIVEIINNHETLGDVRSRSLFISCAKALDDIVYTHGSIIHLKRTNDLSTFLSMKKAIDEKHEFIKERHWEALKAIFKGEEFKEIENYAKSLLSRCKEEVKDLKELYG